MGEGLAQQMFQNAQATTARPGQSFPTAVQPGMGPSGGPTTAQYSDVSLGSPFADAIYALTGAGHLAGTGGGQFNPQGDMLREYLPQVLEGAFGQDINLQIPSGPINRGDLALLLAQLIPGEASGPSRFSDTEGPYGAASEELAQHGVTAGIGGGRFGTSQNVSREQFASLVANALAATGNPLDVPDLGPSNPDPGGVFQHYTGLPNPFLGLRNATFNGGGRTPFTGNASGLPGAQAGGSPLVPGGAPFGPMTFGEPGGGHGDGGHRPASDREPDGSRGGGNSPPGSEGGAGGSQADPANSPGPERGGGYGSFAEGDLGGRGPGGSGAGGGAPEGAAPGDTSAPGGSRDGGPVGAAPGDSSAPGGSRGMSMIMQQLMQLMGGGR